MPMTSTGFRTAGIPHGPKPQVVVRVASCKMLVISLDLNEPFGCLCSLFSRLEWGTGQCPKTGMEKGERTRTLQMSTRVDQSLADGSQTRSRCRNRAWSTRAQD